MGQGQMPAPRGIRGGRLDRSRRHAAVARRFAARLLRSGRTSGLCRPRRHRHQAGGAGTAVAKAATSRYRRDAARDTAAAQQPLRITTVLSRVHWVRPELVAEVKYLTWTGDNLLRQ